jgi:hypothetical protein
MAFRRGKQLHYCSKCQKSVGKEDIRRLASEVLCEDCYIKAIGPKASKPYYKNDAAGFMRRLKESYSAIRQEND